MQFFLPSKASRRLAAGASGDRGTARAPFFAAGLKGQLAIAAASVFAVVCANLVWRDFFRVAPLFFYAGSVVVSSRFGGIRGGLAAAVLSLAATAVLNEPPIGSWRVDAVPDRIRLAEFGALSVLISYLSDRLHRHILRAAEGEERFRMALESAPSGMVLVDGGGRIILVNAQAEELFGYRREELLGAGIETLVPERFRASHQAYREAYQRAPAMRRMGIGRELAARRKDGSEFPAELGLSPIHAEQGTFVLASVVDVTERKLGEERLRKAYEDLEQRVAELEEFSYTVTHDLRAPLRAVEGLGRILSKKMAGRVSPEEQGLLDRMAKAVYGMDRMIQGILSLGLTARRPAELSPVDLNFLLEDVLERYPLREAEIRIRDRLATVNGNEALLTQILFNLLSNAVKFVPDDKKPVVEIATERGEGRVRLTVKDNGIGIPKAFHDRIFRPFERVPGSLAREGTGIGLAIVKKAAERMGGRVGLESEPNAGSLFWVDLPEAPA